MDEKKFLMSDVISPLFIAEIDGFKLQQKFKEKWKEKG